MRRQHLGHHLQDSTADPPLDRVGQIPGVALDLAELLTQYVLQVGPAVAFEKDFTGMVELPLSAAAKLWPYTPIGTLVTIEN